MWNILQRWQSMLYNPTGALEFTVSVVIMDQSVIQAVIVPNFV